MKFFYCKDGPGGQPVLMIGADLDDKRMEELENHTGPCARGALLNGSKGLIFQVEEQDQEAPCVDALARDIRGYFSRKVSALQNARVVSTAKPWDTDRAL